MWVIIFQKKKKKPKQSKCTHLSNYLNKMKQKIKKKSRFKMQKKNDQTKGEEIYLWIILILESTFGIFLFHKINIWQKWIKNYECFQNIIHAKCHLIIVYKVVCIISINKQKHQLCACLVTKPKVINNPLGYFACLTIQMFL